MTEASLSFAPEPILPLPGRYRAALLSVCRISPDAARFERRGFPATPAQANLEAAGTAFVEGYNLGLGASPADIDTALGRQPFELRGFFAEGAAMGTAIASLVPPWRDRLSPLLAQLGGRYIHLMHVGIGWAVARVPWSCRTSRAALDPLFAWLAIDGRGFHDGYFHPARAKRGWRAMSGPPATIYDQGIGRSLWFSCGADPGRIATAIAALPAPRAGDLWAGIGLAATYAGGASGAALDRLIALVPEDARRWFRQGAAFAIAAHARAGTPPEHSLAAAERIIGLEWRRIVDRVSGAEAAARATDGPSLDRYRLWRSLIARSIEKECR